MILAALHLAPNAPWVWLALSSLALVALGIWAYRFSLPPLPRAARRALPFLRALALVVLVWLLARPVLERTLAGRGTRVAVLVDRSASMDLPARADDPHTRAQVASEAAASLRAALRGRASVTEIPFAARLGADSARADGREMTALGAALEQLPLSGQEVDGVVVISDGIVNAGADPAAAARALGVPVHAVVVGEAGRADRAVLEIESSTSARVGEPTPVRVRVTSTESRGTPLRVRLLEDGRELAQATVPSPGAGGEAVAELRVTPRRPGLAVWSATLDSLDREITAANNQRQVAVEVAPGRLGVLVVSGGLNWDMAFLRRALAGDSSLALETRIRQAGGWRGLESRAGAPGAAELRGRAVVVLDAIASVDVSPEFDAALGAFVRAGGGLLVLGGPPPGLARFGRGRMAEDLSMIEAGPRRAASPVPSAEAREMLAWDDDPARGERAWRAAAPLSEVGAIRLGGADRVLIAASDGGAPLMVARRIGRGQALMVNGTGLWRWSLAGLDEFSGERGRRLWRLVVRWLAQPVQGEPLRVRPERWLVARGEPVRLIASLQDKDFQPVAGAVVAGEVVGSGRREAVRFVAREGGSYVATLENLPPGRYRVSARASRGGQDLGQAASQFAVDGWSLEQARTEPDSSTMAAMTSAAGGHLVRADGRGLALGSLATRSLARPRTESLRLWESPWLFALVVGLLSVEWAWRRRRGLP